MFAYILDMSNCIVVSSSNYRIVNETVINVKKGIPWGGWKETVSERVHA